MKQKQWMNILIIVGVTAFIMLFQLGNVPLLDPDEPVYAQTAIEMLANNDFISPRIYGDFWYDKPPMYYWLVAGMIKFFGQGELAARLPSAIFAIITVLVIYFIGKSILSRRAAFFGSLILATSFEFFYLGKAAVTDVTLTCFFSVALLAYLKNKYSLMYVFMGLAVLTKGPIGIVLPAMIIGLHLLLTGQIGKLLQMKLGRGLVIVLVIFAPWYVRMYQLHGMDFINTFLGFHNITRFLQPEHASGSNWYYYIPVLLIGFFPWSMYLMQAIKTGIENRSTEEGNTLLFLISWGISVFIFFSISQTKLISYILPMYPAIALLVGWYIDHLLTVEINKSFVGATAIFVTMSILIGTALAILSYLKMGEVIAGIRYLGIVLGIMSVGVAFTNYKRKNSYTMGILVIGMMMFVTVLMNHIFPVAAEFVSVKTIADDFNRVYQDKNVPVYVEKFYRPGFCYYTGIAGKELDGKVVDLVETRGSAYLFIREDKYLELSEVERAKLQVVSKQADMILVYKV
ncbi:MAG: arnT 1 [Firmicutes bacterium]|nr:arnT 1 [Bacillota bacterium]